MENSFSKHQSELILLLQERLIENGRQSLCLPRTQSRAHRQIVLAAGDYFFEAAVVLQQCHGIGFIDGLDVCQCRDQLNEN